VLGPVDENVKGITELNVLSVNIQVFQKLETIFTPSKKMEITNHKANHLLCWNCDSLKQRPNLNWKAII